MKASLPRAVPGAQRPQLWPAGLMQKAIDLVEDGGQL